MVLLTVSQPNRAAGTRRLDEISSDPVTSKTCKFAENVGVQKFPTLRREHRVIGRRRKQDTEKRMFDTEVQPQAQTEV